MEYITAEEYRKEAEKIHFELIINKRDEIKYKELSLKLRQLKKLRAKSLIQEINDNNEKRR